MPFGSEQTRKKTSRTTIYQVPTAIECEVLFNLVYSLCFEFVTPSTLINMKPAPQGSKLDSYQKVRMTSTMFFIQKKHNYKILCLRNF